MSLSTDTVVLLPPTSTVNVLIPGVITLNGPSYGLCSGVL